MMDTKEQDSSNVAKDRIHGWRTTLNKDAFRNHIANFSIHCIIF